MPAVVPLAAAAAGLAVASSGVGAAITLGLGFGFAGAMAVGQIAGFVVATGINYIGSRALAKKPKAPSFTADAQGRSDMVRSSVESHKIIYGQAKVSGPLVFARTTDTGYDAAGVNQAGPNRFLHLVIALAGHEVHAIPTIYLNDQIVEIDADGWVTSSPYTHAVEQTVTQSTAIVSASRVLDRLSGALRVTVTTAAPHGLAPGQGVTISGTSDLSFNGGYTVTGVPNATSFTYTPSVRAGAYAASATGGSVSRSVTRTTYASYVRIRAHLGTADQLADPVLLAEMPGWTAQHRLRGIAYLAVRLEYNPDAFPTGIPNISAIVQGKPVYDPRSGATAWTDNWALCVRDYLASDYGFRCGVDEINDSYFIAAANISDEVVAKADGTPILRYRANGVLDTATAPLDNLQSLLTAGAGAVTYVQGKFRLHAAAYDAPVAEIGLDMAAGDIQVTARPARQDLFNAVTGTFVDPTKGWSPTDFPAVTNVDYESQDGGERIARDIELPFTIDAEAAQRLGRIVLEKGRQGITVTMPATHAALHLSVYDVVGLNNAQLGWDAKPFRLAKWSLQTPGPIILTLQEESAASYDWNAGMANVIDAAPDSNLPDPFTVAAPGAIGVTETLYATRDGSGVKARATLAWLASGDAFLREYQAEYRAEGAGTWDVLPRTTGTSAALDDVAPGHYDFRVKAINSLGVSSPYSTTSAQITGLLSAPTTPQNLTVSALGGLAVLRWDQSPDLDVRIGGKFTFRHSPDTTSAWNQSTTIGNAVPGSATSCVLPLKAGVYLVKAVDSSGIESADAARVESDQATILEYANVTTLAEDPAFSGAKDGVVLAGSLLKLSATGLFDAIPDFDAVADVDTYGGVGAEGTYDFAAGMDLGSVKRVRLTGTVLAEITQIYDLIDSRPDDIDGWADFDGANAAEGDAVLYVRKTDDDPAGSPTWGAWQRLDAAEFQARAFQFQLGMFVYDPTYNISISQLSVTADQAV